MKKIESEVFKETKKISQTVNCDQEISDPAPKTRFHCELCSVFYTNKNSVTSHIDSVHNGIR